MYSVGFDIQRRRILCNSKRFPVFFEALSKEEVAFLKWSLEYYPLPKKEKELKPK